MQVNHRRSFHCESKQTWEPLSTPVNIYYIFSTVRFYFWAFLPQIVIGQSAGLISISENSMQPPGLNLIEKKSSRTAESGFGYLRVGSIKFQNGALYQNDQFWRTVCCWKSACFICCYVVQQYGFIILTWSVSYQQSKGVFHVFHVNRIC